MFYVRLILFYLSSNGRQESACPTVARYPPNRTQAKNGVDTGQRSVASCFFYLSCSLANISVVHEQGARRYDAVFRRIYVVCKMA